MSAKFIIGLDGSGSGSRAVEFAKGLASLIGDCELVLIHVVEWSPYSFQTPEENEQRHNRKQEETAAALARVIDPAVAALKAEGFKASGMVKHGDVADLLSKTAVEQSASQIIVARSSEGGFVQRLFGSSTVSLVMTSDVPVTVVG